MLTSCVSRGISPVNANEPIALPAPKAYAMVQDGQAILVDVRTDQERAVSFDDPKGAYRIPYPKNGVGDKALFIRRVSALREVNHNAVVLICSKGIRSQWAGEALISSGLTEVYTIVGGLEGDRGWVDSGLPVEE